MNMYEKQNTEAGPVTGWQGPPIGEPGNADPVSGGLNRDEAAETPDRQPTENTLALRLQGLVQESVTAGLAEAATRLVGVVAMVPEVVGSGTARWLLYTRANRQAVRLILRGRNMPHQTDTD
jgi:hypothetical protein